MIPKASAPDVSGQFPDLSGDRILRVLIVAPSLRYVGGQAIQARRLLEHLDSEPWVEARLLEVDPVLPPPLRWMQRIKYLRTLVTTVAYVLSLFRHVRRYDVVHAFSASYWSFLLAPTPALLVGRLFGKRVLINYRSGEAHDHLRRWGWHAIPLLRLATLVVVPSGFLVNVFGKWGLTAVSIPNFLEISRLPYRRRTLPRPRFLSNRNFEKHYNVGDILRAFAQIQRQYPDAELCVVGDGPERSQLELLATELALQHVSFEGSVPPARMGSYYDQADIYLNSPLIDNMPGSILEAFACGLPVVSSNAGGIPFIVRDGENGLLVPSGDFAALSDAAVRLLSEPGLAASVSDNARREAESTFTWSAVSLRWRQAYTGAAAPITAAVQ